MAVTVSETLSETNTSERVSSGVAGLDDILGGGLTSQRLYLLEGTPGTGKTTLALQFLLEGVRSGEPGLYVTLSETAEELRAVAKSHGWSLDNIVLYELVNEAGLEPESEYADMDAVERVTGTKFLLRKPFDVATLSNMVRDALRFSSPGLGTPWTSTPPLLQPSL